MTRWWIFAVLGIAFLIGSVRVQPPAPTRDTCELRESACTPNSSARKRSGKAAQCARRETSGSPSLVVVPDPIDLAPPAGAWSHVALVARENRACAHLIVASSRAPPES
ncbi:MAG: hypothetical protein M4D80_05900 [Myxococcota bacterium]|nr:hypothetical protein [Myxococcota bacterium]